MYIFENLRLPLGSASSSAGIQVMPSATSFHLSPLPLPCPIETLASRVSLLSHNRRRILLSSSRGSSSVLRVGANQFQIPETEAAVVPLQSSNPPPSSSCSCVREFYDRINRRDLAGVEDLISEDCVYEDLIFSKPFVGRKAILEFFKKFTESISGDLQFVIDDICNDDTLAVGVTWHLEWRGRPFPFSKGCSFYRLEVSGGKRQIVYARDCVEPATKPGETALVLIRAVTWILQQFPQLADRF